MNVAAQIENRARKCGWLARTAYHTPLGSYTYGWVNDSGARIAYLLRALGVGSNSRVMIVLPEGIDWVTVFLAVARCGATAICIDPELPAAEHARLAQRCRPDLIVTTKTLDDTFDLWQTTHIDELLNEMESATPIAAVESDPNTPLYVQFTSGTTGEPKGAIHRHGDITAYHRAVGETMLGINQHDISVSSSKIYFPYGFGNLFVYPLYSGSSAVLCEGRQPAQTLAHLASRFGATILHAVPSTYGLLMSDPGLTRPPGLRLAVSAGEPLSRLLNEEVQERWGIPLLNELGSTEIGGACCANRLSSNEPGTIGRPLPGYELTLRDSDGRPLDGSHGEVEGDLHVRGATMMLGYLDDPRLTESVLTDGWLSTGDRTVRRADGRFVHLGRTDDIEIIDGLNLSPIEVEHLLVRHPAVLEVAVAVVANEMGMRELRAYVVVANDAMSNSDPTWDKANRIGQDLTAMARQELASHKIPSKVVFTASLPRNRSGKLMRRTLRTDGWQTKVPAAEAGD